MAAYNPPAHSEEVIVTFPQEHVMLLTLNRPKSLNAMTPTMESDLHNLLTWFENEPSLWVTILTGNGRIFCAGADLKAWSQRAQTGLGNERENAIKDRNGFGAISRRTSSAKPIIAAVNGGAYGGGTEMALNCDIVIASEDAVFALPEVKRGVSALAGGMPRLARIAGHHLASEMLLLGRNVPAKEAAERFHFVNKVVPKSEVLKTALDWARQINENSPDSIQSTKRALLLNNQHASVEDVVAAHLRSEEAKRAHDSDNMKEGLKAFTERRKPLWKNPARL
ncbi:ClpP/crotonase [Abortiporus biennis]|nr:ClpP/crotonase [Abortiporus biennis]